MKLLRGARKKKRWAKIRKQKDPRKWEKTILISDKINFNAKALGKRECHFR